MRLWRKIVSVFAGTMIAAGGIVGTLAVLEATSPAETSGGVYEPPRQWLFEPNSAEAAVSEDLAVVRTWLNETAAGGGPHDASTAFDAALAADAMSGVASGGGTGTEGATRGEVFEPAAQEAAALGTQAVVDASEILLEADLDLASNPQPAPAWNTARVDSVVSVALTSSALQVYSQEATGASLYLNSAEISYTPRANATAVVAAASTESVALLAESPNPAPEHVNWTEAAKAEIVDRNQDGAIEQDTVTLALASQALRSEEPAAAAAINAELRYRQDANGSFGGDIRATAESVRALAYGTTLDRTAAARGLDWMDAQGTLSPQDATYRLRAHAVDGALDATPPPGPPASDTAFGGGISVSGAGAKGVLALLFLGGGIGLSLTLVTDDALKGARRRLYDTVRAEPGLHVNELRRRLSMSPSSIEYHLAVLTGAGLVISEDDGRYKRFYANGAGLGLNPGSPNSRNALGALRRPHATEIVQHLLERGDGTAREVSRALGLHESAASRRLDHLEHSGLLVSDRVGRERRYTVRERQAAIKALTLVEAAVAPQALLGAGPDATADRSGSEGLPATAMSP